MSPDVYKEEARYVWGVCYRMTGSAPDADDLVQETFQRALESPPEETTAPWRPWLVRVAVNLARDKLRRRRHAAYTGPWLPSPIETDDAVAPDEDQERRYGMMESVSYAFLVAAEALTPRQRAVLLLRDVFDYSVREAAETLTLSHANVKTTLHRARAAMVAYDLGRTVPTLALQRRTRAALESFATSLLTGDLAAVELLLAESVHTVNDGGGEFRAALRVVRGRGRVARFYLGLAKRLGPPGGYAVRMLNGLPALVLAYPGAKGRIAPRSVLRCDIDAEGRIACLHTVLATAKLRGIRV